MIPILFGSTATSFTTNGLGRLSDAKSCVVTEERNGSYELELEYPLGGIHFSDIKHSAIIVVKPFQNATLQAFRIYKIERKAKDLTKVYARHISYQLSYIPVSKFTADSPSSAFQKLKNYSCETNPFTFWTDYTGAGSLVVSAPDSARSILGGKEGSILDHWHGEYEWDNYTVKFHKNRGSDKGVTIRYGKNLKSLKQEESIEDTITGVYPYWKNDGQESTAIMDSSDYCGFKSGNTFYEDKWHTKALPSEQNKYYYDVTDYSNDEYNQRKKLYTWDGTNFKEVAIGQYGDPNATGLDTIGNIDLHDRPVLIKHTTKKRTDEDTDEIITETVDEVVTLGSYIIYNNGLYVLLPTIFKDSHGNAVEFTQEQSTQSYNTSGQHLGKFNTQTNAKNYQKKLELEMKRVYENVSQAYTYVELPEKVLYSTNASNFPYKRSVVLDCSSNFQGAPTEAQLRAYTQQYITDNKIGVPKVSLDVEFVDLYGTAGYNDISGLQTVNLCDTVTVEFSELGVSAKEKVIETEYDVLKERYNKIKIGDSSNSLSNTIANQMEQIQYRPTQAEMNEAVDRATGVLNSGMRGHVVINRNESGYANEILFLDDDNVTNASNVLRINMNGIGFSSTGYKGPYWQSWTNDGHLTLGGINNSYGNLTILDEDATPVVEVDKDGLKLVDVKYKGYLIDGDFWYDPNKQNRITRNSSSNVAYYDYITSQYYRWNSSQRQYVLDQHAGVLAEMTHGGLTIKKGVIDLLKGTDFHFKVDDDGITMGDWHIDSTNRQMLQSMDQTTGMSPLSDRGDLTLWAGWRNSHDFAFCVNDRQAFVTYTDPDEGDFHEYEIGQSIYDLWKAIEDLEDDNSGEGPGGGPAVVDGDAEPIGG